MTGGYRKCDKCGYTENSTSLQAGQYGEQRIKSWIAVYIGAQKLELGVTPAATYDFCS